MGLIDLRTDLKSLRYGKDRIGGGSSNQPYKTRPIPDSLSDTDVTGGPDFLLRGGTLALRNSVRDVSRLSQMFFDFKSPNGLLFTAKQNVLSLTNVNSFAGEELSLQPRGEGILNAISSFIKNNVALNQGAYLPTSTLLGAAGNPLGIHLNKQGLDPTKRTGPDKGKGDLFSILNLKDPLGLPLYFDTNAYKERETNTLNSRLIGFLENKQNVNISSTELYSYKGGPGAVLGIGKTAISLPKPNERTGINNPQVKILNEKSNTNTLTPDKFPNSSKFEPKIGPNILNPKGYSRLDYNGPEAGNIEKRVNLGNPGKKQKDDKVALDSVNYRQIYKTSANNPIVPETNDLVKFRIGVIDNDNPSKKTNIHFRAFIDSMDDSYSADWQAQKFMGRGENFYRYNGFDRTVSLSWTVVAQSKKELIPMYQKLNYLASVCAPDYSDLGYMRGNLIKLTIGGYLYEQVGIMKGINYTVPQESPWEIGIPYGSSEGGTPLGVESDGDVKELPHMIKVTGFQFIPIHDFVPSVQKNSFKGYDENPYNTALAKAGEEIESLTNLDIDGSEYLQNWQAEIARKNIKENKGTYELKRYGTQKYIALSNGLNPDNYS